MQNSLFNPQDAITVVNNLLTETNMPGWDYQAQVHYSYN